MTSVDDLFRKSDAGTKRKLEDPTQSFDRRSVNKSAKRTNSDTPHTTHSYRNDISVAVDTNVQAVFEKEEVLDNENEDIEAGPSLPPEDLEEEGGDDEEGRFFGGGVSKQERQVLDYIDQNEADGIEEEIIDSTWLRKMAVNFEKKITKNTEMRTKHEDRPEKFMSSEADLDTEIRGLSILAEHTELYSDFVDLGCVNSLVLLLSHENADIAIEVVQILRDLTDEDTGAAEEQWTALTRACMEADVINLLEQNLRRLDERQDGDRDGVYHVLEVLENLMSDSENVEKIGTNEKLMRWLTYRIRSQNDGRAKVSQNQQYAAEILAIILQGSKENRDRFVAMDGVDVLLDLIGPYRKADPEKDSDEQEWLENLFDCLICIVDEITGGEKFVEGEGVELCLIMIRDGKMSRTRGLTVLDHAMSGDASTKVCERFIEAAGLKTIFGLFMKKHDRNITEHLIGIFASLLRYQPGDSAGRIRTLAKFVEKDYEKTVKLMQLRRDYFVRVTEVQPINAEEDAEELFSRQLDAGLFSLQTLDVILAWLVAEDDGARRKISDLFEAKGEGLEALANSLNEQLDGIGTEDNADDTTSTKAMLEALLKCI